MARSYSKTVKCPFCVVNHKAVSKWHKDERRRRSQHYRGKLKQQLQYGVDEDIVDLLYSSLYNKGFKDSWMGPADGNVRIYKHKSSYIIKDNSIYNKTKAEYYYNKYKRK